MATKKNVRERTKKDKVRTSQRIKETGQLAFRVKDEWLKNTSEKRLEEFKLNDDGKRYFRTDLTKTLILTMLVLALETALWQYFSKR